MIVVKKYLIKDCILYCDFIYLDTKERRSFIDCNHEYLIEQVQLNNEYNLLNSVSTIQNINLTFNHVKELVWIIQDAIKNKHSLEGGQFYNNTNNY